MLRYIIVIAVLVGCSGPMQGADQPGVAETRLREALRNTVLQLRMAQNDNTTLQSQKADLENKARDLEAQLKLLTNQVSEAQGIIATLRAKADEQSRAMEELKKALEKSQADFKSAAAYGKACREARGALEAQVVTLNRTIGEQKMKNAELYQLGREILLRYEKVGLGEVVGAKEPFVGTTRVKLENYVQDFQDRLTDQKISNP